MKRRYITQEALQEWEKKREGEGDKKKDGRHSYHPWKLLQLSTKEPRRRRISHRTKLEDKLPSFPHAFNHSISIWSCPAVAALTKAQFLSPFSLPNLLYWARWIWAYSLNSKERPKADPTIPYSRVFQKRGYNDKPIVAFIKCSYRLDL